MRQLFFTILFLILLSYSCKKEERLLPEHFVGIWDWEYTVAYYINGQGQVYKVDTLRPNSHIWGIDFDSYFEVKENGDIHLYKNDSFFLKVKAKELIYSYDVNPDVRNYQSKDDFFNERGLYKRIYIGGNILSEFTGVWSFPLSGGATDDLVYFGNEVSIVNVNGRFGVYNVFKRSQ